MSYIDTIVFDKTGTITEAGKSKIKYTGIPLNNLDLSIIKTLTLNSQHPHSTKIFNNIKSDLIFDVVDYNEYAGEGISGKILGLNVKIGSEIFTTGIQENLYDDYRNSRVYVSIGGALKGYFEIKNIFRKGLKRSISQLSDYNLHLLSGDHSGEKKKLEEYFGKNSSLYFNMSAQDKLNYIKNLQSQNKRVLMVGDGLNDAGALKQSDIGISVSEKINNFTPASDGILESDMFEKLVSLIVFSKDSMAVIKISFVLSILYNITGLVLALQGLLTPLFAAILMPVSSISIATFGVLAGNVAAKRRGLI
jgi:Cu+-exporting ATPase